MPLFTVQHYLSPTIFLLTKKKLVYDQKKNNKKAKNPDLFEKVLHLRKKIEDDDILEKHNLGGGGGGGDFVCLETNKQKIGVLETNLVTMFGIFKKNNSTIFLGSKCK